MRLSSVQIFFVAMLVLFSAQIYRCITKYLSYETIENRRSVVKSDKARYPLVTVLPVPGYKHARSGSFLVIEGSVDNICPWAGNASAEIDYRVCLDEETFSPSDFFALAYENDKPVPLENMVTPPYPLVLPIGKTFTFELDSEVQGGHKLMFHIKNMTNLPVAPGMIFAFHFNESYFTYVYIDYNNFDGRALHNYVPSTNVQGSLSIQLRRRIRLNTPKSQCISEEGYSMLRCANKFVEQTIGCSSPWENFETRFPTCKTKEQFNSLMGLQTKLILMAGRDFLTLTGCHHRCETMEVEVLQYAELRYPLFNDGSNALAVIMVSSSIIEIRESLLYDYNSLVGEVGGSLGLFLGMSLVQIYNSGFTVLRRFLPKRGSDGGAKEDFAPL